MTAPRERSDEESLAGTQARTVWILARESNEGAINA
jgi:hypothetical protein